ncbi:MULTISPECIES: hypothetical protein [unclassified Methylobacterium]|jgi:hypothetical protein|uniref:hypothetical protein n=1 Tax=unclassified Methylobacterium TaxID=2615210 RepID=UPI0005BC728D|nr:MULTISPECIES: hypothetical protein [unclassified Methylobacterium]SFU50683.1 hypothetical protein SAMN02799643_00967 [Methylobacterium sp. UNCCL125]
MSAPTPVPPDVIVDRSGGRRAIATNHSVRRYVERSLGIGEEVLAGLDDAAAVEALHAAGYHVQAYRDRLSYFGGVQLRYRADGVVIDGIRLVLDGEVVVTVVDSRSPVSRRQAAERAAA